MNPKLWTITSQFLGLRLQLHHHTSISLTLRPSARLPGGGGHEHEPVPSVLLLPGAAGSLSGLHGSLLRVLKIHQAEIQPGLVNTSASPSLSNQIKRSLKSHTRVYTFLFQLLYDNVASSSTGSTLSHAFTHGRGKTPDVILILETDKILEPQ